MEKKNNDMKLFEKWLDDNPYIYYEYNFYLSPLDKVICFRKIEKKDIQHINSNGYFGNEKNGIMRMYIDMKLFLKTPNRNILSEIASVYDYNKNQWLKEKRLEKIRLINGKYI